MDRLRIVIGDDHELVRRGIRSLLEARKDWELCAEAGTGREVLEAVDKFRPDVVILDISLPDKNGIEVAHMVRQQFPGTEILIHVDPEGQTDRETLLSSEITERAT